MKDVSLSDERNSAIYNREEIDKMLTGLGCDCNQGARLLGVNGLGQTYPNTSTQMPYSNVLIQGWSDANGNLSSTWQGYYLATFGSGILPPMLSGATVLSSTGAGTVNGQLTLVITDAQVQAILHGNQAATPAANYIPNQTVAASAPSSKALAAQQVLSTPPTNSTNPITGSTFAQPASTTPTASSSDLMLGGVDVTQLFSTYGLYIAGGIAAVVLLSSMSKR